MATIQWRPEINALTTPPSYRILFLPRNVVNSVELAKRMAKALPNYSEEEFQTFLAVRNEIVQDALLNGEQVTEENNFTYSLSFTGKLDKPDDPLPDLHECLHVRVHASPPFVDMIRKNARTRLNDVLCPQSVIELSGTNLFFDPEGGYGDCIIEGTQSGRTVQSRFPVISNTSIMLMPEVPDQANPWNNEYRISISTHYSEHGTLRTGTYARLLRTPLLVEKLNGGQDVGILSGSGDTPLVSVVDVTGTDEMLRIQVVFDIRADALLCNLMDMKEEGMVGPDMVVNADDEYILAGRADHTGHPPCRSQGYGP